MQVIPKVIWEEHVILAQLRNKVHVPNSPSKLPLPLQRLPPLSNTPIPRPTSPSQTVYGSNQPFCHSTLSGQTSRQTDRPTDGIGERSTPLALALAILIESDARVSLHVPKWKERISRRAKTTASIPTEFCSAINTSK